MVSQFGHFLFEDPLRRGYALAAERIVQTAAVIEQQGRVGDDVISREVSRSLRNPA